MSNAAAWHQFLASLATDGLRSPKTLSCITQPSVPHSTGDRFEDILYDLLYLMYNAKLFQATLPCQVTCTKALDKEGGKMNGLMRKVNFKFIGRVREALQAD